MLAAQRDLSRHDGWPSACSTGTKSNDMTVAIPVKPTEEPPLLTVNGACNRGDPCDVRGAVIVCEPVGA